MSASTGRDGPSSKNGVPISSPNSRDVYWFFLMPAFCLGFAIWLALALVTGQTVTAQVQSCSGRDCQVTWVENGQPRYASVDRSPGSIPGSHVAIQTGDVGPGGTVSIWASHYLLAYMLIATIVTTPLAVALISGSRRGRTKAWTEWHHSHPTVYE